MKLVRVLQGLLGIGFIFLGFVKVSGNPMQVDAFTNTYGYSVAFMYIVGVIELAAAIGLLIGLWRKNVTTVSSGILAITMAGAVVTHFLSGEGIGAAVRPLIFLILSLIVLFGNHKANSVAT